MAGLQFNKTRFDEKGKYVICTYVVQRAESKLVKLETSCTVILPPNGEWVSVLW